MEEVRNILIDKVGEKYIADMIIKDKLDADAYQLKMLEIKLFDYQFDLMMPYVDETELYELWGKYSEVLVNFNQQKFNIHHVYHKLEQISGDIKIRDAIKGIQKNIAKQRAIQSLCLGN